MKASERQVRFAMYLAGKLEKIVENEIEWEKDAKYPSNRKVGLLIAKKYAEIPEHVFEDRKHTSEYIEFLQALLEVKGDLKELIRKVNAGELEKLKKNEVYGEAENVYSHYIVELEECIQQGKPFSFP